MAKSFRRLRCRFRPALAWVWMACLLWWGGGAPDAKRGAPNLERRGCGAAAAAALGGGLGVCDAAAPPAPPRNLRECVTLRWVCMDQQQFISCKGCFSMKAHACRVAMLHLGGAFHRQDAAWQRCTPAAHTWLHASKHTHTCACTLSHAWAHACVGMLIGHALP
eukprot:98756-Chlamydomonas_euryale.AAC.3